MRGERMNRILGALMGACLVTLMLLGCEQRVAAPIVAAGGSGDSVGNGGGIGEKNVLFAWLSLPAYYDRALEAPTGTFTSEERALLVRLRAQLATTPPTAERILFTTPRENPRLFRLDGRAHGVVRSAVTGGALRDRIAVNREHLYERRPGDLEAPLEIAAAAALLTDELTHSIDRAFDADAAHVKLDLLCAKLQLFLRLHIQTVDWMPFWDMISATAIHFPGRHSFTQLLFADKERHADLTPDLERAVRCLQPYERLVGSTLWNLHWHKVSFESEGERAVVVRGALHGWITIYCERPPERRDPRDQGLPHSYSDQLIVRYSAHGAIERGRVHTFRLGDTRPRVELLDCGDERRGARPTGECH